MARPASRASRRCARARTARARRLRRRPSGRCSRRRRAARSSAQRPQQPRPAQRSAAGAGPLTRGRCAARRRAEAAAGDRHRPVRWFVAACTAGGRQLCAGLHRLGLAHRLRPASAASDAARIRLRPSISRPRAGRRSRERVRAAAKRVPGGATVYIRGSMRTSERTPSATLRRIARAGPGRDAS